MSPTLYLLENPRGEHLKRVAGRVPASELKGKSPRERMKTLWRRAKMYQNPSRRRGRRRMPPRDRRGRFVSRRRYDNPRRRRHNIEAAYYNPRRRRRPRRRYTYRRRRNPIEFAENPELMMENPRRPRRRRRGYRRRRRNIEAYNPYVRSYHRRYPRRHRNPIHDMVNITQGVALTQVASGILGFVGAISIPRALGLKGFGNLLGALGGTVLAGMVVGAVSSGRDAQAAVIGGLIPTTEKALRLFSGGTIGFMPGPFPSFPHFGTPRLLGPGLGQSSELEEEQWEAVSGGMGVVPYNPNIGAYTYVYQDQGGEAPRLV